MISANDPRPWMIAEAEDDPYVDAIGQFEEVARQLNLEQWIIDRLKNSEREVRLNLSYALQGGEHALISGVRVLHSSALGPGLGPLYLSPGATLNLVKAAALKTTWQCAWLNLPFGGSSGALLCDPQKLSETELKSVIQAYVENMGGLVGRFADVIIPHRGCSSKSASWMVETRRRDGELSAFATVTHKSPAMWGLATKNVAASCLVLLLQQILTDRGVSLRYRKLAIQGFGGAGSAIAREVYDCGAQVVGLADISGAMYCERGIDLCDIEHYCQQDRLLYGYTNADAMCNADLLEAPVDILILAAAENQITETNARHIRAPIVVEVMENAISSAAHAVLRRRGILVVPELLANGGALIAAFLEWRQGLHFSRFSDDQVRNEMKARIENSWRDLSLTTIGGFDLRQKVLHVGISRVADTIRVNA